MEKVNQPYYELLPKPKVFEGKKTIGHNVTEAFFAQHQLESLHLENDILSELKNFAPNIY